MRALRHRTVLIEHDGARNVFGAQQFGDALNARARVDGVHVCATGARGEQVLHGALSVSAGGRAGGNGIGAVI